MTKRQEYIRTAALAIVVAAAIAGGVVWIKSSEETVAQKAQKAASDFQALASDASVAGNVAPPNAYAKARCAVNRSVGIVTFHVAAHNGSVYVQPWVGFASGPPNRALSYGRSVASSAEINVSVDATRRPVRCRLYFNDGTYKPVPLSRIS